MDTIQPEEAQQKETEPQSTCTTHTLTTDTPLDVQAEDTVFVFLAGHGQTAGADGHFWYLAEDAVDESLTDPELRTATALSTEDLRSVLAETGARRRAVVLDTCSAGAAASQLVKGRDAATDRRWM